MQYYSTRGVDIDADAVVEGGGGGGHDGCFAGGLMKILSAGPADCRIISEIRQFWDEQHPARAPVLGIPARSDGARVGGIGRPWVQG